MRYLVWEGRRYGWKVCVASMLDHDPAPIKQKKFSNSIIFVHLANFKQCDHAIRKADVVIGLLPTSLLLPVAERCIYHGKGLITPSPLDRRQIQRKFNPEETGSLILSECGFSPGLDHITAKKAIDLIRKKGGKIETFRTFSGSLLAERSIDNPWQFKLTEPCERFIDMGKPLNRHLIQGQILHVPYPQVFARAAPVSIPGLKDTLTVPDGNALAYQNTYELDDVDTVEKGRIIRRGFEKTWSLVVRLGLTDAAFGVEPGRNASFYNFLESLLPYAANESVEFRLARYLGADGGDIEKLKVLGLFNKEWVNGKPLTSAASILQHLMEENLSMKAGDKDNVVMQHQLGYYLRGVHYRFEATLVVEGQYPHSSAMARATGLTTAAVAKAFLLGNIKVRGFRLPLTPDIYEPVLQDLTDLGLDFHFREKKVHTGGFDVRYNFNLN